MSGATGSWEEAVLWLRQQPDRQDLVRSAYYDDPLKAAAQRYFESEEWSAVRQILGGREGRALDVGAGRGIASYALAREGFEVTALEPDPSDIVGAGAIRALAESIELPIMVIENVSEALPLEDRSFDVVFGRAVLHHTSDLDAAMREFARVLKPGGLFIGIREHVISNDQDLPAFFDLHPLHHLYGGEKAFRLPVYVDAIKGSGLRLEKILKPLESPLNYAPIRKDELSREIGNRFAKAPGLPVLVRTALAVPLLRKVLLSFAGAFDHRPGRLYSFVASRPI